MMKFNVSVVLLSVVLFSCSKEKRSDTAGEEMQSFVIKISRYARSFDSDFIVIPQNGPELAFNYLDPNDGLNQEYMNAVDGFGIEELFYNGTYDLEQERLDACRLLVDSKKIMVAEYVSDNNNFTDAIQKNLSEGFICFPRESINYDYLYIPSTITNENANDITKLQQTQNYLYLISSGNYTTKQEMISAITATNYDAIIIDLFFEEEVLTYADVQQLKTKANGASRLVISYLNIGSAEKYRYYWKDNWKLHKPLWLKKEYDGYPDEIWVKFWKKNWHDIIFGNEESYTKRVINSGFDGIYLDNVEAYYFLYFD